MILKHSCVVGCSNPNITEKNSFHMCFVGCIKGKIVDSFSLEKNRPCAVKNTFGFHFFFSQCFTYAIKINPSNSQVQLTIIRELIV